MDELNPCPFCGSKQNRLFIEQDEAGWFYVICAPSDNGCAATGPAAITKEDAVNLWNRRIDNGQV